MTPYTTFSALHPLSLKLIILTVFEIWYQTHKELNLLEMWIFSVSHVIYVRLAIVLS